MDSPIYFHTLNFRVYPVNYLEFEGKNIRLPISKKLATKLVNRMCKLQENIVSEDVKKYIIDKLSNFYDEKFYISDNRLIICDHCKELFFSNDMRKYYFNFNSSINVCFDCYTKFYEER